MSAAGVPVDDSPVVDALGLEEPALEETLAWARVRSEELLRTLEDRELLALLDRPGPRVIRATRPRVSPADPAEASGEGVVVSGAEVTRKGEPEVGEEAETEAEAEVLAQAEVSVQPESEVGDEAETEAEVLAQPESEVGEEAETEAEVLAQPESEFGEQRVAATQELEVSIPTAPEVAAKAEVAAGSDEDLESEIMELSDADVVELSDADVVELPESEEAESLAPELEDAEEPESAAESEAADAVEAEAGVATEAEGADAEERVAAAESYGAPVEAPEGTGTVQPEVAASPVVPAQPALRAKTGRPPGPARAHPWMMRPPAMGPTQVHPRAKTPAVDPEPASEPAEIGGKPWESEPAEIGGKPWESEPAETRGKPWELESAASGRARKHATLELRTIVEPDADDAQADVTELDEVELPDADWDPPRDQDAREPDAPERVTRDPDAPERVTRDPDAPDRDAPVRRRSFSRETLHDTAHQPPPERRPSGAERRKEPRYSLSEPAVIEIRNWSELVTLYVRDISCGGMFVGTTAPPARDAEVTVQLLLPNETGTLDFDGVVVRVVTPEQAVASGGIPGFGIQFRGLTRQRRRALERLVEQAEQAAKSPRAQRPKLSTLGLSGKAGPAGGLRLTLSEAERQQMQQLRSQLAEINERGDLEVLGLSEPGTFEDLRSAFERLARRWHPGVAHRDAPPEIRELATEIFLRIERAYRRLCDEPQSASAPASAPAPVHEEDRPQKRAVPRPESVPPPPSYASDGPRPETVIGPAPTAPPKARRRPAEPDPRSVRAQQRAKMARRMVGDLVDRGEKLTRQLKRRGQKTPSQSERQARVQQALQMISSKQYPEAARVLVDLIVERPELRLRVLLDVVNARQAIKDRDFARARNCYQSVLQMDPDNGLARRELLMLSAMEGR